MLLLVEAPAHTTMFPLDGILHGEIMVNADLLIGMLDKLPQTETVELNIDEQNQKLIINVDSLRVAVKGQIIP